MQQVFRRLQKVSSSHAPVLFYGEQGTGKQTLARAIHYSSGDGGPFVAVNFANIPENYQERELFGNDESPGLILAAKDGTLCLLEIDQMSISLQARFIQWLSGASDHEVGEAKVQAKQIRFMTTTSRNLVALVRQGLFRGELVFQLGPMAIKMPPLRERGEDRAIMVRHFIAHYAQEMRKPIPRFTASAISALEKYSWPGNVSELRCMMRRMVATGKDTIEVEDLFGALPNLFSTSYREHLRTLHDVENEHIRSVLEIVKGNRTRAARILGIDRKTLRERVKRSQEIAATIN
jgi:DNA-binding NtrC family response regulator